ncbi:MAG: hypothetical protein EBS66_10695 [Betaproteobacteria bacterium]|nr:hypothetical protein [Betaproteobacteria bacterium]
MTYTFTATQGATFSDLIEKVYRRLLSGQRDITCALTKSIDDATTSTIELSGVQANMITPGGYLSVDLEVMYIESWDGTKATVARGYSGSKATAHDRTAIVYVNPKFTKFDIGVAINDDLLDLSSPTNGLFRIESTSIPFNPVFQGYDLGDLPNNFLDVLSVNYRIAPPSHNFPAIRDWRVQRQMFNSAGVGDSIFPSGQGIQLYQGGYPGLPMYLTYAAPFIPLINLTDDVTYTPINNLDKEDAPYNYKGTVPLDGDGKPITVANLPTTALDIPVLGAQIALMASREIKRNFIEGQPDSRKAADVPSGAIAASTRPLMTQRQARIDAEGDRLARQYNVRLRGW